MMATTVVSMSRIRGKRALGALVGVVALVVAACSPSDTADDGAEATSTPPPSTTPTTLATSTTELATTSSTASSATRAAAPTGGEACGGEPAPGQATVEFEFEGRRRTYELYVPRSYDGTTPTPLVVNWHGLGSTGAQQLLFSEYGPTAESGGFLVVAPTGVPAPGDGRNSWELTDDADPTRDDLAFADVLLDHVATRVCVDDKRIYTTGMSNGGYFSSRLVCELAERVAAASSVAGLTHSDDCRPSRPVPYLAFHGVDDEIVPYAGGGFSALAPGVYLELMDRAIPDEFAEFAADFGCEPEPESEPLSEAVTRVTYEACDDGVEAIFYSIADAGHTWPGSIASSLISQGVGLGATNLDVSATELSWEFFSRHRLS